MNKNAHILKQARVKAEREIRNMVTIMGNDAKNHFDASFTKQGFVDDTLVKWKPRERTERSRSGSRGILIGLRSKGGLSLHNSLRKHRQGQYAIRITTNVPYANVHNEGLRAGRGKGFKMKKRQFVGYSAVLNRSLIKKFNDKIQSIFK